jgi:hypothetical protein
MWWIPLMAVLIITPPTPDELHVDDIIEALEQRYEVWCDDFLEKHEFKEKVTRWCPLVRKHWGPDWTHYAMHTLDCESRGDPEARNGSHYGLFQHTTRYWTKRSRLAGWEGYHPTHPEANIATSAHLLFSERARGKSGTSHWTCKTGHHAIP